MAKNNLLLIIILFGLILRLWGINFGLYHPDEPLVVNQTLAFGTGNILPSTYYYPPFFHYFLFILYGLFFVIGWIAGPFRIFDNFLNLVLINQIPFYIIGRVAVALVGTATILIVYAITKRLHSKKAALLSSIFMSCMYLHVRDSHYCTVDVPMTFMLMLAYSFVLRIVDTNNIKDYLWSGVLSGLAMATKYNAGILIPCIGAAGIANLSFKNNKSENISVIKKIISGYLLSLLIFLVICFYFVLDFPGVIRAFDVLMKIGKGMNISTWYRLRVDLFYGVGLPLELLGLIGFLYLMLKKGKKGFILVLFPVLYLVAMRRVGQPFARYSVPLLPFFAISAGIFLDFMISKLNINILRKKVLLYCIVALVIFIPSAQSIYAGYLLGKPDTRDFARDWVYKNISTGSRIAIDNSQYAPLLYPTKKQLEDKINLIAQDFKSSYAKHKRLELLAKLEKYPPNNYTLFYFGESPAEFIMHTPVISRSENRVLDNDIEYIITNDDSEKNNAQFYASMRERLILLVRFDPFRARGLSYSKYPYSYMPVDYTLFNLCNNGIGVNIYKVKK